MTAKVGARPDPNACQAPEDAERGQLEVRLSIGQLAGPGETSAGVMVESEPACVSLRCSAMIAGITAAGTN